MAATTQTCCVLFADVAGSTRLYERLGDAEALRAIDRCLNRVERAIVSCGGKVVKTIGDELMAVFVTAEMACHAAGVMQARVDGLPKVSGDKLAIRVGFHYGSVLVDGGDVFGNTVNVAARITEVTQAGQIITSAETALLLTDALRSNAMRQLPAIEVKGKTGELEIVEILWDHSAAGRVTTRTSVPTAATKKAAAEPKDKTRVVLRYGDQEVLLRSEAASVTLGRDKKNNIVVLDPRASRSHARIELRKGQCVLIDTSSNGTFVLTGDEVHTPVHKSELVLEGSGRICFGHVCMPNSTEILSFEVLAEQASAKQNQAA